MEEIARKDAPSPITWRQFRRFLPYLLAISLGAVSHDVAASVGYRKGEEFRSLQHAYGEALLRAEPSHDWPPCVHVGLCIKLNNCRK